MISLVGHVLPLEFFGEIVDVSWFSHSAMAESQSNQLNETDFKLMAEYFVMANQPTPPNIPPLRGIGFNKALLRETNG